MGTSYTLKRDSWSLYLNPTFAICYPLSRPRRKPAAAASGAWWLLCSFIKFRQEEGLQRSNCSIYIGQLMLCRAGAAIVFIPAAFWGKDFFNVFFFSSSLVQRTHNVKQSIVCSSLPRLMSYSHYVIHGPIPPSFHEAEGEGREGQEKKEKRATLDHSFLSPFGAWSPARTVMGKASTATENCLHR